MPRIRFVYFDLGNVLVSFDPAIACANVAALFGIPLAMAEQVIYTSGLETRLERGQLTGDQFTAAVRDRVLSNEAAGVADDSRQRPGPTIDPNEVTTEQLLQAISDMFMPIDAMGPAIDRLRRRGLGVGILSNTCEAHWGWLTRQSYSVLSGQFDGLVLSHIVGAMKPDAAIYDAAERAAEVDPREILFLDDRAENVAAAKTRGWNAEWCFGGTPALRVLQQHGLIPQMK